MGLRFSYRREKTSRPVLTLGGVAWRPHPVIDVELVGPTNNFSIAAYLDTMADDTVFPEWIAARIGVDLASLPLGSISAAGGKHYPTRYVQVQVKIADGIEQREWKAWIGFTSANLRRPLLGFAGFLQFFTATFHGDSEEVELTVNSQYPGT